MMEITGRDEHGVTEIIDHDADIRVVAWRESRYEMSCHGQCGAPIWDGSACVCVWYGRESEWSKRKWGGLYIDDIYYHWQCAPQVIDAMMPVFFPRQKWNVA